MAFVVSAYKVYKEFTTMSESYCELKRVEETPNRYYSRSIEIWRK